MRGLSLSQVLGAALSCLLVSSVAFAAPTETRVGYVDLQKALSSSKAGVDAQKKYEVEVKKAQDKLDAKKSEVQKLKETLDKQRESLSAKALADKEEELVSKEKELKRNFQDSQESLRRRNAVLVGDLVKKIREVVADIGKSEGFTLILERDSQAVLYADNKIDITEEVVKRVDSGKD